MSTHRPVIILNTAAVAVLIAATLFVVQPAGAGSSEGRRQGTVELARGGGGCTVWGTNNTICLYRETNFGGATFCALNADNLSGSGWRNIAFLCGSNFNDDMESWINNSPHDAKWATENGGAGTIRCMNDHGQNASVTPANDASSVKVFAENNEVCT